MDLLFILFGGFSILAQTMLLRQYLVVYGGSEIALGLFFCTWLAWVGAGAAAAGWIARRLPAVRAFLPLVLLYAASPLAQILLVRSLRLWSGVPATEPIPFDVLLLGTLATNMPVSLLTGALFTLGASIVEAAVGDAERAVGRVYLVEAVGGLAGGALATAAAWWGIPVVPLLAGSGACLGLAVAVRSASGPLRSRWTLASAIALAAALALVIATPAGRAIEEASVERTWRTTLPAGTLIESLDTPYRQVTLARLGTQGIVLYDGDIAAVSPAGPEAAEDAALLQAQSGGGGRVLLVGVTSLGLLAEILRWPVERVVLVEQDPVALQRVGAFMGSEGNDALGDPRVEVARADPRTWVEDAEEEFDIVAVRTADPDTLLANRLYTVDFYRAVEGVLAPGGIFSTRITTAENRLGTETERYARSVHHTLREAFGHVAFTPGERCILWASPDGGVVTDDPAVLERRLETLAGAPSRFDPARVHSVMEPERIEHVGRILQRPALPGEPPLVNTDARPVTHLGQLMVVGRTLDSGLPAAMEALEGVGIWMALVPILLFVVLRIRHLLWYPPAQGAGRFDAGALASVAGLASISLLLVLMHAFQSRFGALHLHVGLMNALFMGGLAAGALVSRWLLARSRRRHALVCLATLALAVVVASVPWIVAAGPGWAGFVVLFIAGGAAGGATFPAAAALNRSAPGSSLAALLESADHWGGAAGGLLTGVVLLPLMGLRQTCLALAAGIGAVLLLVVLEWWQERGGPRVPGALRRFAVELRILSGRSSFPWKGLTALLVGVSLGAMTLGWMARTRTRRQEQRLDGYTIRSMVGKDAGVVEWLRPFVHYRVSGGSRDDPAVLVSSAAAAPGVEGWGGPLHVIVLVAADGTLERVRLGRSRETPAYIEGIARWMQASFEGASPTGPFVLADEVDDPPPGSHEVDALTGATVTSRAVVEAVSRTHREAAAVMGVEIPGTVPFRPAIRLSEPAVIYLLAAMLLAVLVYLVDRPRGSPWPRRVLLATNLVLGGFVFETVLTSDQLARLALMDWPAPSNTEVFVLMGGTALLAAAFGPLYCSTVCPFGAAQELLSLIGLGVRPSASVERKMRYVRYVVLALLVVSFALTGSGAITAPDPLINAFTLQARGWAAAIVIAALAASVFSFRFWCRTFCPVGALLSMLGQIGFALRLAPRKRYGLCDLGASRDRDPECLHCNRCLTGSTLVGERLERRRLRASTTMVDRLAVVTVAALAIGILVAVLSSGTPVESGGSPPDSGTPRDVDEGRIRHLIEEGKLSDHEALWWEPVEEESKNAR